MKKKEKGEQPNIEKFIPSETVKVFKNYIL